MINLFCLNCSESRILQFVNTGLGIGESVVNFSRETATHWFGKGTLLENLTDGVIAKLYVTKFSTISLYVTKLYVTYSAVELGNSVISYQQRNPPKLF